MALSLDFGPGLGTCLDPKNRAEVTLDWFHSLHLKRWSASVLDPLGMPS